MKRILIIEDNNLDFQHAETRLRETGEAIEIERARCLKEAEAVLKKRSDFDVIFLDPGLPDVVDKKYEAYGKLCRLVPNSEVIQVVTGADDPEMVDILERRGSKVMSKSDAYEGDAMVEGAFGAKFLLDRMRSYRDSAVDQMQILMARELVPMRGSLEMEIGKLRLQSEERDRSIVGMQKQIGLLIEQMQTQSLSIHGAVLKLDAIGGVIGELSKEVMTVKEKQTEGTGKTTLKVEMLKNGASIIAVLLTGAFTLLATLATTGKLPGLSQPNPAVPIESKP